MTTVRLLQFEDNVGQMVLVLVVSDRTRNRSAIAVDDVVVRT
jgi:hypothetical protein